MSKLQLVPENAQVSAPLRAVIYARVSQDRNGRGRSVAEQDSECRTECSRRSWPVVATLIENDRSASRWARKDRPEYDKLIKMLQTDQADVLVTWEASRAQRDLKVYVDLRDLCAKNGKFWSYNGRLYDLTDSDDRFATGLDALLAEKEADQTRNRVLRSVRANAVAGNPHGRIPFGYRREYDPRTGELVRQVPDETTAPIILEMAERVLRGEALFSLARELGERGVQTQNGLDHWHPAVLKRMLISPTLAGLRIANGEVIGEAQWPGIITEATHHQLVDRLTHPSRKTNHDGSVRNLLVGIVRCGVQGCDATCIRAKNRGRPSYICGGGFHVARKQSFVDEVVEESMIARLEREDAHQLFLGDGRDEVAAQALADATALRARLFGFYDEAAEGRLSAAALGRIEQKLQAQIAAADAKAQENSVSPLLPELIGPQARVSWHALSLLQKRDVLRKVMIPRILKTNRGNRTPQPELITIQWL